MDFRFLTSYAEIRELIAYHNEFSEFVVLDTETTDKDPRKAKLLDIQMSGYTEDEAVMFGAEHAALLLEIQKPLVFWNMRYDVKVLYLHGVDIRSKTLVDPMLIDHLVDENREHSLDSHVQEKWQDDFKEQFWTKYDSYGEAPLEERTAYGCKDVVYTGRVYRLLRTSLGAQGLSSCLVEHVHRLARALLDTEIEGISVDLKYCTDMGSVLKGDIVKTERELRELGGFHCEALELDAWVKAIDKFKTEKKRQTVEKPEFNFQASGQVAALLYDQLKLPVQISQKSKSRTADDKALEALGDMHPIVPKIRDLRKMSKMYGSFIEGILDRADGGRIYPSFNVNGTVTGRISHSDPNLGQMPSKGEWAKIRGIFIPDPGRKIISSDYGQLEVCIAAHFSQDKNLLKIIHEGASKHDITAESLGIPRNVAKTLNFACQYQCGPKKIAEILACSKRDGEQAFRKYWETYAGEKAVIDQCKQKVDAGIDIVNPFGRRRRFPRHFKAPWEKEAAYRQAYSSLIQGTGGDLTSWAFYHIAEDLKGLGWGRGLWTIHDEVLVEALDKYVSEVQQLVQKYMIQAGKEINLTIPLTVDCSEGLDRWQK